MSPRWGFKYLCIPCCYKHAAPLGLNTPMSLSRLRMMLHLSPQSRGLETKPNGLGDPTPTHPISRSPVSTDLR